MSFTQAREIATAMLNYAEILEREANDHLGGVREEKPEPKPADEPKSG